MSRTEVSSQINLTNVLLAVVLALSGWTLKSVADLREEQSAIRVEIEWIKKRTQFLSMK